MVSIESVVIVSLAVIVVVLLIVMGRALKRAFTVIGEQNDRQHEANRDLLEAVMTGSDAWRENERTKLDYKMGEVQLARLNAERAKVPPRRPDGEEFSPPGTEHVEIGDDTVGR